MASRRRPESGKVRPKYSFTNSRESTCGGTAVAVAVIVIIDRNRDLTWTDSVLERPLLLPDLRRAFAPNFRCLALGKDVSALRRAPSETRMKKYGGAFS